MRNQALVSSIAGAAVEALSKFGKYCSQYLARVQTLQVVDLIFPLPQESRLRFADGCPVVTHSGGLSKRCWDQ